MVKKRIGQITVKRVGKKWAACISDTPEELYNSFKMAEHMVEKLRDIKDIINSINILIKSGYNPIETSVVRLKEIFGFDVKDYIIEND